VTDRMTRIRQAAEQLAPDMVRVLREMVRIPTINPPGERYEEFVAYARSLLDGLGYDTEVLRVPPERLAELAPHGEELPRPNLIARLNGPGGPGPRIHVNGHYDVVPAASDWTRDPYGGELDDGRVYGRGACDMKSGIVAQIYAVEALRRAGVEWPGRITHSLVPDEETVGNTNAGAGFIVEQGVVTRENTDAVIITEPFELDGIGVGHKGAIWGSFTVKGKQAHGSTPQLGVNAVEIMARFLARVEQELQPKLRERVAGFHVLPVEASQSTLSFDTIQGGFATNIIPDRCTVTFNRRLVQPETIDGARREMLVILDAIKAEDSRFDYEYRETYATDPTQVSEDEPLVRIARDVIRDLGREPRVMISAGSHDQRFFVHGAGITNSILYGPGMNDQAHQADEHITVADLVEGTVTLALILDRALAGS
jgi:succinyl-diaminopimelate desuccinylase